VEIVERIIQRSRRLGVHTEVYSEKTEISSFIADTGRIREERGEICGIGLRVVKNNNLGSFSFSFEEGFDEKRVLDKIERFSLGTPVKEPPFTFSDETTSVSGLCDPAGLVEVEKGVEIVQDAIKAAKNHDGRIERVTCQLTSSLREIEVSNTFGIDKIRRETRYHFSITCSSGEGQGREIIVLRSCKLLDTQQAAIKAAEMAINARNKQRVEEGRYDVVLHPGAVGLIISKLLPLISADRGGSLPLMKMVGLNPRIGSTSLSIYDDGTIDGLAYSVPFDDEGWPTQPNAIIEQGVFRNPLYDNLSAQINKRFSTGNGMRSSYRSDISVSPHNLLVEGGDLSRDELYREVQDGILISDLIGSRFDPVSGVMTAMPVNSFRIERGEVSYPLQNALILMNIYDLITKVEMLSKERIEIPASSYAVIAPFILVKNVLFTH